jgi:hypothetical protein
VGVTASGLWTDDPVAGYLGRDSDEDTLGRWSWDEDIRFVLDLVLDSVGSIVWEMVYVSMALHHMHDNWIEVHRHATHVGAYDLHLSIYRHQSGLVL